MEYIVKAASDFLLAPIFPSHDDSASLTRRHTDKERRRGISVEVEEDAFA